jgi:hypothetical protein
MRVSGVLLGMLLWTATAQAQEEAPSMALLEFLGEWGEEDAAWVDQALDGAVVLTADADRADKLQANEESNDDE